jgi:hypothetical protein
MKIEQLDEIYKSFGFEIYASSIKLRIYLYKKSRYYGAEIIKLQEDEDAILEANGFKSEFSSLGFATTLKSISSLEEADVDLFKSFFSFDSSRLRLKKKYELFVQKQKQSLGGFDYKYIESPYEILEIEEDGNGIFPLIEMKFAKKSSELIVIEASAGYGKTCTAYELLTRLTVQDIPIVPIFTELSRNRGAKIFRYILLDEIDIEFPTLNSELVIREIKKGRVPLIIDGFDELLDKVNLSLNDEDGDLDEVESMLDTIGNLLGENAKIILTTRRTAIFNGPEFHNWQSKWENKFKVTRISIKEPRIKDWVGDNRFQIIKENDFPIQSIANPVLLSFLRNITDNEFDAQIMEPDILISHYFTKMLERERERQNLVISAEKQYEIFKNVVKLLLDFDITVETKEFFKEIIKEQNSKLLEYTRTLYTGVEKPTIENLVDTLATHALLDRKGRGDNQIGFINDFVLGIFIGEIICDASFEKIYKDYSTYMIELAVTAYRVQSPSKKIALWNKLINSKKIFLELYIFYFDIILLERLAKSYSELTVYDQNFYNISFIDKEIKNSVFLNCLFKRCIFDTSKFENVSLINCMFDNCQITNNTHFGIGNEISTIQCRQENCSILPGTIYENEGEQILTHEVKDILKKIMSISKTKGHHIVQLLRCYSKNSNRKVLKALSELEFQGYISITGNHIYPVINKMQEIKTIIEDKNGL